MFFLRLDGSPNLAMMCNIVAAILNIILDYLFIFPFGWGMFGAAIASCHRYYGGSIDDNHLPLPPQMRIYAFYPP